MSPSDLPCKDPFQRFRSATPARIGLGRAGDALPTAPLLRFELAHALARDAVHGAVDWVGLRAALDTPHVVAVESAAGDRTTYLRRPDLGRRLSERSAGQLTKDSWDLVLVIADGLSAAAVQSWAVPTATAIRYGLSDWRIGPLVFASQARVALGDDIGERMGAKLVAILIGERPGLSVANSLGIYLTLDPKVGRRDSERNCISNIHAAGLSPEQGAAKLIWLARRARTSGGTGVALKDDAPAILSPSGHSPADASFTRPE